MSDVAVDFNTPGATHVMLHSSDGLLWANRVEFDFEKQSAAFFHDDHFIGTIAYTRPLTKGEKLSIGIRVGFVISPG